MKVLVLCEYSGVVRDAFRREGHDATSLDLLPTDCAGPHIQGDAFDYLISIPDNHYDLIIAHPPCTALCVSGNSTYGEGKPSHWHRIGAAAWTEALWELCKCKAGRVAMENPVGVLARLTSIPKASYVQPWMFGHIEQKKTGLHLHNLEPLLETDNVHAAMMQLPKSQRERMFYLPPSPDRWKIRSTTYAGIASAMAKQWGVL